MSSGREDRQVAECDDCLEQSRRALGLKLKERSKIKEHQSVKVPKFFRPERIKLWVLIAQANDAFDGVCSSLSLFSS